VKDVEIRVICIESKVKLNINMNCTTSMSWFLFQIVGSTNVCYASEHSEVNPVTRQMILKTRNVSITVLFNLNCCIYPVSSVVSLQSFKLIFSV
jgi:hypothetical protein